MPRGPQHLFDRVQKDGRKFLAALQAEIRDRQSELEGLREQAARWLAAVNGGAPAKRGPGRPPKAAVTTRRRAAKPKRSSPAVDWDSVLAKLPRAFTSADLEKATDAARQPEGSQRGARAVEPGRGGQEERAGEVSEAHEDLRWVRSSRSGPAPPTAPESPNR
jgi:hypothetical protein